ncbi:hypothetical protein DFQ03_1637 [Maribacter caenipelagi]|uniref:Uncharacterized protein n=1 Tax=Maribacter caenipelagi TaxID=1447781 RepID=A0A4R7D5N3_9FLAO|nr:hypothetical protein [Maribacter caenipelagi]TDS15004.1 hypothetical protein DFQ03_1637 [Maribacter caenipelagi]
MELIEKDIEDWIEHFATIVGEQKEYDLKLREQNPSEFFLQLTLPNNYQEYAIALHSFWINNKIPKDKIVVRELSNEEFPEDDFSRVTWKDFHERKYRGYDLNKAIMDSINHTHSYDKQLNNELYPVEGLMDKEHLISLVEIVLELYGNQEIELFYTFLATKNWEKDLIYSGKISELPKLFEIDNLRLTPSLIYPKEKNWVVNTDYDLAFTTIGGERKFISELSERNHDGIVKIAR